MSVKSKMTKKDVLDKLNYIHANNTHGSNQIFLQWMVSLHSNARKRENVIYVYPGRLIDKCFYVRYSDGRPDVSISLFIHCMKYVNTKKTRHEIEQDMHQEQVNKAFRNEVLDQTREVRRQAGLVGDGANTHVGHGAEDPHYGIRDDFLCIRETNFKEFARDAKIKQVYKDEYGYKIPKFEDRKCAKDWSRFHQENARCSMQTAEENRNELKTIKSQINRLRNSRPI